MTPGSANGEPKKARTAAPEGSFSEEAVAGAPWMIGSKLILFFLYLAISILTVRGLGKEAYGVLSIGKSIVEYLFVFAALGLNAALLRFIPELTHHRNKAGLVRFLTRSALIQALAALLIGLALCFAAPFTTHVLDPRVSAILPWFALLLPALLAKDYFNDSLTALFLSKKVALLSLGQTLVWLALTLAVLHLGFGVPGILAAQALSIFAASLLAARWLIRHVSSLDWRSPPQGIGRERTFRLAIPVLLNQAFRTLMLKYTEVFFLGLFVGTTAAGVYDLGYSVPMLVITFIPLAVQTLLAAGFNQAFTRDPASLPSLIDTSYKLLMVLSVPLAAFGVFFAPRGIELVYGADMAASGPVASAFCVLHLLPLISMPLAMAITAREKTSQTLHLMILQVLLNVGLDLLLIPRFGIPGAIGAVALTFFLTIPLRIANVRRIIGPFPFPAGFLLRLALPCSLLAGLIYLAQPKPSLPTLLIQAALYIGLFLASLRFLRLVSLPDLLQLRTLLPGKAARLFDRALHLPHPA
ncbi:MAG: oligosaccharide flippase family protein [Candidatus Methylacidiphilales bacterium]|nr:oligosaccharide flippase family protein [Candidatus Methylacidiphilales bacterium]